MITSPVDYKELLYRIQDYNRQYKIIQLPKDEPIYNIDLNTRIVDAPKMLSVEYDHNAETIYFKCDRYFDHIDLADEHIAIVIQYENASPKKEERGYIYAPSYKDTITFKDENKIAFPWVIEGPATAFSGTVSFSIKFYNIDEKGNYTFCLNTMPSKSQVLHGMNVYENSSNFVYDANMTEQIYKRLEDVAEQATLYWLDLEGE